MFSFLAENECEQNEVRTEHKRPGCLTFVFIFVFSVIITVIAYQFAPSSTTPTDSVNEKTEAHVFETLKSQKNPSTIEAVAKNTPQETVAQSKDITIYKADQYKVGVDLPAGQYMLIQDGSDSAYFSLTSDANGHDIIVNDNFDTHSIVDVFVGEYLQLKRCYAISVSEASTPAIIDGAYPEGCYIVGLHIPSGEYKVEATGERSSYICIYTDTRRTEIESNDNFEGSRYVSLSDGQMFEIKHGRIYTSSN